METFKGLYIWKYSDQASDVPGKILGEIPRVTEKIIAACWVDQFMKKGASFVVLTQKRVVAKSGYATLEVAWEDVEMIDRAVNGDVVLHVAHGRRAVFSVTHMPVVELMDKMFRRIETLWKARTQQ